MSEKKETNKKIAERIVDLGIDDSVASRAQVYATLALVDALERVAQEIVYLTRELNEIKENLWQRLL